MRFIYLMVALGMRAAIYLMYVNRVMLKNPGAYSDALDSVHITNQLVKQFA